MGRTPYLWIVMLVAVLCVAGVLIYEGRTSQRHEGAFTLPRPAADFTLKAPDGSEFRLRQHRGEVVLLSFGYLRDYTSAFDPTFVGLTGSSEYLAQVREAYQVVAHKQQIPGTSAGYLIAHSAYVYVIDPQGQLHTLFPFGMSVEHMTHEVKLLLEG